MTTKIQRRRNRKQVNKKSTRKNIKNVSLRCLTYLWQEKVFGVVLHQGVSPHIHSDVDLLALLSVGAVQLVHTRDCVSTAHHWTCERTLTRGARPILTTGVHRTLSIIIRNAALKKYTFFFIHRALWCYRQTGEEAIEVRVMDKSRSNQSFKSSSTIFILNLTLSRDRNIKSILLGLLL